MEIVLTSPQTEFFTAEEKAVGMVCGFGTGKTFATCTLITARKLAYPTVDLLYLAPTYQLIRDIFYPQMGEILTGAGIEYHIKLEDSKIVIPECGEILCRSMDKPERIIGFEVGDAFLDELDVLNIEKAEHVWNKTLARIRKAFPDGKKNQMYVSTTPEGFKFTYKMFVKNASRLTRLIQAPTMSNPHLPPDYVETLLEMYPSQLIEAYLEGKFVNLTAGAVYYAYKRHAAGTDRKVMLNDVLHIGMDFNAYNMAGIVFVEDKNQPVKSPLGTKFQINYETVYSAVDEFVGLRDTPDMIDAIKEKYPDNKIIIYPDAAGKSVATVDVTKTDHKLLRKAGFQVKAPNKNPLVKERVAAMNNSFEKGFQRVNVDACPRYVEALEQQTYDDKGAPDKKSGIDHELDAPGYFIYKKNKLRKSIIIQKRLMGA